MPRRRTKRNRIARRTTSVLMHNYHGAFSPGSGQINITSHLLGLLKTRALRVTHFSIQLALRIGEKPNSSGPAVENVLIKVYDPAFEVSGKQGANTIKTWGPFMIGIIPKTFRFKVPYHEPTEMGDEGRDRKILSVYDFGEATDYGLVVNVKVWVQYAANVSSGVLKESQVVKQPIFPVSELCESFERL